jgi:hypothetical protein
MLKGGGLAETIEEIRQHQQAHGYQGLTPEESTRDEEQRRADEDDYEQRMQQIRSQTQSGAALIAAHDLDSSCLGP